MRLSPSPIQPLAAPLRHTAKKVLGIALSGCASLVLSLPLMTHAQSDKSIKFILPVAAGSGVDTIMRASNNALSKAFGAAVVVDNQPGAGGVVGTAAMIRSAPDGLTLSVVSNNHVIYPSVLKSLPFDPLNDITPIAVLGTTPLVLVVNPKIPANNAKELVALLKANPGKYNYGSSGNGTILQLGFELFKEQAKVFTTHIPYRGVGPMVNDLMGGQVDMGVVALPSVQAHIKGGTLRAIGIMSAQRVGAASNIPTFAEQGFPKLIADGWFAVIGPKGLPAEQVKRIHDAFETAFNSTEVKETMASQGNTIAITTPEVAKSFFKTELAKYAAIVKRAGVVPQ